MTDYEWTPSQAQRMIELGGASDDLHFSSEEEREAKFSELVSGLQKKNRSKIRAATESGKRHPLGALENDLATALVSKGFLEVKTPMIISKHSLEKMGITDSHPLSKQVFWLDPTSCLRPMLAPNLYFLMRQLKRSVKMPLLFFEIGPCFRKESKGTSHLEEFTMLNLVEMAPKGDAKERLREHIDVVMKVVGLEYELKNCCSDVYIETLDVEINGLEIASGAIGPHVLDKAHGITDAWAGVGFGLERLLMIKSGGENVRKVGRSLIYIDGARIDI